METLGIGDREAAVLAELLLRGPQTAGELRSRARRMRELPDLEALEQALDALRSKGYAETADGGRAPRTSQLLCRSVAPGAGDSPPTEAAPASALAPAPPTAPAPLPGATEVQGAPLAERVEALEREVAELTRSMAQLREELGA
jgi:uncharacterized protein YceH (UPF0502 family)